MPNKIKQVAVTVSGGVVTCTPSNAVITQSNVLIVLQLHTTGYAFPTTDAIVVANPGTQFPNPSWTIDANTAAIQDVNSAPGDFDYTVTVVEVGTSNTLTLDPSIRNEG